MTTPRARRFKHAFASPNLVIGKKKRSCLPRWKGPSGHLGTLK